MHSSSPRRSAGCRSRKRARASPAQRALQRGPFRSLAAAENEPQPRFAFQAAGHVGQDLQALLAAHVAGIQRHDRVGGDAELRAVRAAVQVRRDRLRVDPVRQQHGAGGLHALSLASASMRSEMVETRSKRRISQRSAGDGAAQPGALEQAQLERGVHFIVLHVQPGASAAQPGGQPCRGRAEQRRLDHQDDVGRPAAARSRLGRLDRAKLARCSRRLTPPGRAGTHNGRGAPRRRRAPRAHSVRRDSRHAPAIADSRAAP